MTSGICFETAWSRSFTGDIFQVISSATSSWLCFTNCTKASYSDQLKQERHITILVSWVITIPGENLKRDGGDTTTTSSGFSASMDVVLGVGVGVGVGVGLEWGCNCCCFWEARSKKCWMPNLEGWRLGFFFLGGIFNFPIDYSLTQNRELTSGKGRVWVFSASARANTHFNTFPAFSRLNNAVETWTCLFPLGFFLTSTLGFCITIGPPFISKITPLLKQNSNILVKVE